jgi:hypothetical protein
VEDLAFRYLAAGTRVDNWALSAFHRRHSRALNVVFTQVLEWARAAVWQALRPVLAIAPNPFGRAFALTLKLAAASFNVTPSKITPLANSSRRDTVSLAFL